MDHLKDITFWVYVYNIIVASAGFLLFCFWWYKVKAASEVYKYFTFLLLAISFEKVIALIIRIDSGVKIVSKTYHDTWIWHVRTLPTAVILTLIIIMASRRLVKIYTENKKNILID